MFVTLLEKLPLMLLLVLSAISVTVGDFFAKYWSGHTRNIFYILAVMGYIGSSVFYIPTLLKEGLIITSIIWSILSTLGFLLVGLLIFKEVLTTSQIIGVSLGIISIVILSFGK